MTPATRDYLLRLAIEDRDRLAEYLVHRGESHSAEWGEAAAAVRELLEDDRTVPKALQRAEKLVPLLTVRQVISAGDDAIEAAGLNPWCINEGLATGDECIGRQWWLTEAIEKVKGGGR